MTHEVVRHLLDEYVTGELAEDARAAVSAHVAGCEICRAEVEDLRRILTQAADLPKSIEPPNGAIVGGRGTSPEGPSRGSTATSNRSVGS